MMQYINLYETRKINKCDYLQQEVTSGLKGGFIAIIS